MNLEARAQRGVGGRHVVVDHDLKVSFGGIVVVGNYYFNIDNALFLFHGRPSNLHIILDYRHFRATRFNI